MAVASIEFVDIEHGLWCPACAVSSGVALYFATTTGDSMTLRAAARCAECGEVC